MKKFFGNIKMNILTVLLFAVATGVYTGFIMLVPFLKETSFQDIGISYEWWVLFAVIVVTNCKKSYEAALKCFFFFLISQPLVYAVEVIFGSLSFKMAWYYYRTIWFFPTLLTLPGGFIAYYCKKQNWLGSIILGIGDMIQLLLGFVYGAMAAGDFPHHLLSSAFCIASAVLMTLCIQGKKKYRIITFATALVLSAALALAVKLSGLTLVPDVF